MASRLAHLILQDPSRSKDMTSPGAAGSNIKFNSNPSSLSATPRGTEELLISPRPVEKVISKLSAINITEKVAPSTPIVEKPILKTAISVKATTTPITAAAVVPTVSSTTSSSTKSSISSKFGSALQKCTSCQKSVCPSSPEELIAVNRIWHKSCFVCGGTSDKDTTEGGVGHGCKKTLTLQNYLAHDNQPYCHKCHSLVNTIKTTSSSTK